MQSKIFFCRVSVCPPPSLAGYSACFFFIIYLLYHKFSKKSSGLSKLEWLNYSLVNCSKIKLVYMNILSFFLSGKFLRQILHERLEIYLTICGRSSQNDPYEAICTTQGQVAADSWLVLTNPLARTGVLGILHKKIIKNFSKFVYFDY